MKAVLIELAKLAAQSYFTYARLAQLSDEETNKLFFTTQKKFAENDPADLPDV